MRYFAFKALIALIVTESIWSLSTTVKFLKLHGTSFLQQHEVYYHHGRNLNTLRVTPDIHDSNFNDDTTATTNTSSSGNTSRRDVFKRSALIGSGVLSGVLSGALTRSNPLTINNKANASEELTTSTFPPKPKPTSFSATWTAIDGLNSLDSQSQFVSFDASAYKAMKDDPTRTPQFQKAIEQRLGDNPEDKVVVDLGTGPFALFALIAAQLGAGKVYAIEASSDAAQSARNLIKKQGYDDIITVIEDFSTNVNLEHKADFVIAEIVGSIASEEGAYATIRSAHEKLLKNPNDDASWIPSRIQTYAAPASYTLHTLFGPPEFDWAKLKDPVRFNCRDKGLELLSDPVLVEDLSFAQILTKEQDVRNQKKEITFTVDGDRVKENQIALYQEFRRGNSSAKDSEVLANKSAHSMSGIALWPRIILNENIIIDSRGYGDGSHQRSHWQTVLPIVNDRPIENLNGGDEIVASFDFDLPDEILKPAKYSITGSVKYNKA